MGEMKDIVRMNDTSHGDKSYANNSALQRTVISKTRTMVERAIKTMHLNKSFPEHCFAMADLGCSSGPNTLLSVSHVIDAIVGSCESPPELQAFLNDLPTNDFNSVFMSLPRLYSQRGGASPPCYISGTPGSFYGRLFPSSSLHFVHSSYSLHWLSQVPPGLESNKGNVYVSSTSPGNVFEAYLKQFQKDLSKFLSSRAMEMKAGGAMVLALLGRSTAHHSNKDCCLFWEMLSKSLLHMANQGMIAEKDVDSFNIPNFFPCKGEVRDIIEREGSFDIEEMGGFEANWDPTDTEENESYVFEKQRSGQNVANLTRAATQSILATHFGDDFIEDLFARYAIFVGDHLSVEKTKFFNILISITKKY